MSEIMKVIDGRETQKKKKTELVGRKLKSNLELALSIILKEREL